MLRTNPSIRLRLAQHLRCLLAAATLLFAFDASAQSSGGFWIVVSNSEGVPVESARLGDVLEIEAYIFPPTADRNTSADVFIVAATPRGWYMRNGAGAYVPWSVMVADLVPAFEDVNLSVSARVPIHAGTLPFTGSYRLYVGYRRDGGPLVYLQDPVRLNISP